MSRRGIPVMLACLLLVAALPVGAASTDWKLVIRVKGTVESLLSGAGAWTRIVQSRLLSEGDQARTGQDSAAQIRLADGSVVAMGPDTTVRMEQFSLGSGGREVRLKLDAGRMRASVGRFLGNRSRFEVETPNAVLAARGTDFFVAWGAGPPPPPGAHLDGLLASRDLDLLAAADPPDTTLVAVYEGSVEATDAQGRSLTLEEGDTGVVGREGELLINPPGFQMVDVPRVSGGDARMHQHRGGARPLRAGSFSQGADAPGDGGRQRRASRHGRSGTQPVLVNPQEGAGGVLQIRIVAPSSTSTTSP